jgi:predicted nucleotidyltransferase
MIKLKGVVTKPRTSNGSNRKTGAFCRRAAPSRKRIRPKIGRFTILIGSRARRTQKSYSDVDIVRIGHTELATIKERARKDSVSFIDYDVDKFSDLYEKGSLFLYHVFREGRLLEGDFDAWNYLKENFRVSTNFKREISRNRRFLKWLQRGEKFRGAVIPYLAHTCRALKNLAIFSLAQKRRYVFDKRAALRGAFPNLPKSSIDLLISANDSFERSPRRRLSSENVPVSQINRLRKQVNLAVQHAAR